MKKISLLFLLNLLFLNVYAQDTKEPVESKFQAEIKFENPHYEIGVIKEGVTLFEFRFTNTGDSLLIIKDVRTPCGCTTPSWPREPIKPGESGIIIISYNSKGRIGNFHKRMIVFSNAKSNPSQIIISGTVESAGTPSEK